MVRTSRRGRALAARGGGRHRQGASTRPTGPGERAGMVKIKRVRTIDAVVMGWRPGKEEGTVGALILGLYEPDGKLREVGHSSGFTPSRSASSSTSWRRTRPASAAAATPSRWTAGRDLEWVALRPELVVEVTFDHVSRRAHPPRREGPALARRQARRSARSISWRADRPRPLALARPGRAAPPARPRAGARSRAPRCTPFACRFASRRRSRSKAARVPWNAKPSISTTRR